MFREKRKINIKRFDKNQLDLLVNNTSEEELKLKKEKFLFNLQSKVGKYKYRRYDGSPLRYAGGKSRAVGYIIEQLPTNINKIVSPFFGGGSFEIACASELGVDVIGYDIFDLLINYWQVQIEKPIELYSHLKKLKPTKEEFFKVKEKLKAHWLGEKIIGNKIELAALYYFNHNTSYGPGFLSWPSYVYLDAKRYDSILQKVKNFEVKNIKVEVESFENVIPNFSKDFLYCDPPYFLSGDSKMFKGIYPQRNFPIHHNNFNHELLRDLLLNHKGGFILSYNDCSTIRKWYSDFKIIEVEWQYTMGQGETRIGQNRLNKNLNHIKKSHELLIVKQ